MTGRGSGGESVLSSGLGQDVLLDSGTVSEWF